MAMGQCSGESKRLLGPRSGETEAGGGMSCLGEGQSGKQRLLTWLSCQRRILKQKTVESKLERKKDGQ